MPNDENQPAADGQKSAKKPILIGLLLTIVGAAIGFGATQFGILGLGTSSSDSAQTTAVEEGDVGPSFAFVAIEPLIISLPSANGRDHLRFAAQLEVNPSAVAAVEAVKPRIVDILNGYLRAVQLDELEDPTALMRLRAQMLRRIHVIAGPEQVKDLLIMEFVLS